MVKYLILRIFVKCSLYKVLSEIDLIEPFTMDFYSLIRCIPMSTNRFTQWCDCFQSQSENFLFLKHYYKVLKNKWQNVNRLPYHEHIFMKQNFLGSSTAPQNFLPWACDSKEILLRSHVGNNLPLKEYFLICYFHGASASCQIKPRIMSLISFYTTWKHQKTSHFYTP